MLKIPTAKEIEKEDKEYRKIQKWVKERKAEKLEKWIEDFIGKDKKIKKRDWL